MKAVATTILCLTSIMAASASADGALVATLESLKVSRAADGSEQLAPSYHAQPNDVFEYRATYRNQSSKTMRRVIATVPVPQGFEYVAESAAPVVMLASLDGKTFSPLPLIRAVPSADGAANETPIPAQELRFLRWEIGDMQAGTSSTVTARVRFAPTTTTASD